MPLVRRYLEHHVQTDASSEITEPRHLPPVVSLVSVAMMHLLFAQRPST